MAWAKRMDGDWIKHLPAAARLWTWEYIACRPAFIQPACSLLLCGQRRERKPIRKNLKQSKSPCSFSWNFPVALLRNAVAAYSKKENFFRADAERGWFELSPAYSFAGISGKTSDGEMKFPQVVQQALQMDGFAEAIINKTADRVPGEMGRQDVKILQAIYKAMNTGQRIETASP